MKNLPEIKKRTAWIKLVTLNYLFERGIKENSKYNRTKEFHLKTRGNNATFEVTYFPDISRLEDGSFLIKEICEWNRGFYQGYGELTESTDVSIIETACITEGSDKCIFEAKWKSPSMKRRIRNFLSYLLAQDIILDYQAAIDDRDRLVSTLEQEVEQRTQELLQAERTAAIKETELKLEQSFSGGLAHEVRNALFDGSVEIADLSGLEVPDTSSLDGIIGKLGATIFDLESQGVPRDVIYKTLLPMLKEIDDLSKRLSAALERYSKATPTIKNSIGRGLVLAEQFLRYSKMQEIERGEEEINVYAVARKIGEKYQKAFGDSGIKYTIDSPQGEKLIVKGDYVQLEQILENPVLNARDALEGKAGEIGISLSKNDDSVNIIVKDTGKGIPEENMKKVFDPFFSTKGSKGTGLGLKFVKKLVEAYEGSISIESKVGVGTKVYISLRP